MKMTLPAVAILAAFAGTPAFAGDFVALPTSGTDIRINGANNPAADPMFLATSPFATGYTLMASFSQPLMFDLNGDSRLDWVGTVSDRVYRNNATQNLTFALRLEDTHPFLSPNNLETEINLMWRSGFAGYTTAAAWYGEGVGGTDIDGYTYNGDFRLQAAAMVPDGFVFRAGTQPGREVSGANYDANTVGFRTDTSVGEANPSSGWYLVQTNAQQFGVVSDAIHIRQSAGTGPEGRPQRDWLLTGFAPTAPVPEPSEYAMLLAGLGLVGLMVKRRQQARA